MLIYLLVITIITFFLYGYDKLRAKHEKWRISEATLLWFAVFGGSVGALLGMQVWRHKTQHKKFIYGVPAILIIQITLVALYFYYYEL
ncbi:MAG: DUF1294 domain-containing protein [Bacteroidaceae bacterium]|nr:DUF1294 domain-containing protein [Bacteroidaceae bacterium]